MGKSKPNKWETKSISFKLITTQKFHLVHIFQHEYYPTSILPNIVLKRWVMLDQNDSPFELALFKLITIPLAFARELAMLRYT